MRERTQGLSRRGFCASMLAAAGIAAAACSGRVGPNPSPPTSQSPAKPRSSFPTGSAGESPHPPTRLKVRSPPTGGVARSGTHSASAPARSLMAARGRWRATTTTGGSRILT
jgi:hypothetical protein